MQLEYLTNSASATKKLGEKTAKKILRDGFQKKNAVILGLIGNLGGGKTTFLQGFAKGLGIRERILSPTFIIVKKFRIKKPKFKVLYHIDCYRIQESKEILKLNFEKIISDNKNIITIEWAGRIKEILPRKTILARFYFLDKKARKIKISNLKKTFG